ncbi:MAG: DUF4424 family protein, partial [Elusimicrobiaceae bacterium]|nr:DUF4424 family protein [Elusimicrobiaceae bacterium]
MKKIILCCGCVLLSSWLWANDTAGQLLPTGEIQFKKQADIVLKNEALVLSEKIAVDYLFENTSGQDITTEVFFPLPSTSPLVPYFNKGHNFHFKVFVNEQEIPYQTYRRITLDGKDVTRYFDLMGLDSYDKVVPLDGGDFEGTTLKLQKMVEPLGEDVKQEMRALGMLEKSCLEIDEATGVCTRSSQKEQLAYKDYRQDVYFYWTQTFPANTTTHVYHEYFPSFLEQSVGYPYASGIPFEYKENNDVFWKAAAYIVTTANNWQQPIGQFHLLVLGEKGVAVSAYDQGHTSQTKVATGNYLVVEKQNFIPSSEILFEIASNPRSSKQRDSLPRLYKVKENARFRTSLSGMVEENSLPDSYVWAYPAPQQDWFVVLNSQGNLGYTPKQNLIDFWK